MIAVVDYGAGNVQSVLNALDDLKVQYIVSNKEPEIYHADKIIFPGVGEASFAMRKLHLNSLVTMLRVTKKPLLGICLGMQLLMSKSDEGDINCLGLIKGNVKKLSSEMKIPQIGWNQVCLTDSESALFTNIPDNSDFYFVHSYYCKPYDQNIVAGITKYGQEYCSILIKNNIVGVQFHLEKSGMSGSLLLKNIINYFTQLC